MTGKQGGSWPAETRQGLGEEKTNTGFFRAGFLKTLCFSSFPFSSLPFPSPISWGWGTEPSAAEEPSKGAQDIQVQVLAFAACSVCDLGHVPSLLGTQFSSRQLFATTPIPQHDLIQAEKIPRDGPHLPGTCNLGGLGPGWAWTLRQVRGGEQVSRERRGEAWKLRAQGASDGDRLGLPERLVGRDNGLHLWLSVSRAGLALQRIVHGCRVVWLLHLRDHLGGACGPGIGASLPPAGPHPVGRSSTGLELSLFPPRRLQKSNWSSSDNACWHTAPEALKHPRLRVTIYGAGTADSDVPCRRGCGRHSRCLLKGVSNSSSGCSQQPWARAGLGIAIAVSWRPREAKQPARGLPDGEGEEALSSDPKSRPLSSSQLSIWAGGGPPGGGEDSDQGLFGELKGAGRWGNGPLEWAQCHVRGSEWVETGRKGLQGLVLGRDVRSDWAR